MKVAIIPARSGSKGVPDKNIQLLWGIPLLTIAIKCAKATRLFDKIIVSTDSQQYAEVALEAGAEIPFLRPQNLAGANSKIDDVIENLIQHTNESVSWDTICLLEPTSPMRTPDLIEICYQKMEGDKKADSCLSVNKVPLKYNPVKQLAVNESGNIEKYNAGNPFIINRQELKQTFIRNGGGYIIKLNAFKKFKSFIGEKALFHLNTEDLISIDSPADMQILREWEKNNSKPDWLS